jgi:deazaflavin-dependent oxidoreductase (nitroreductase family)
MAEQAEQFLYLTTTGRITGRLHEIEIWFVEHNGRYYLVSEMRERADWVRNILHQPAVTFRVGDQSWQGHARPIYPEQEPELVAAVSAKMDAKYEWSNGLIIELSPLQ